MAKSTIKSLTSIGLALFTAQLHAESLPAQMVENASKEIDYIINDANAQEEVQPLPVIDDATFLRRAYLSIAGRIPTYEESKAFLDSEADGKRGQLIDLLVNSPGFNSHIMNFYGNLLRLDSTNGQAGLGWDIWLKQSIQTNKPYDQMVYEMLAAEGHCADNPAVGYYLRDRGMLLDNVSNTAKVFLGTQIGCAQCHDHPFEDTTQNQYYQLAAFTAPVQYYSQRVNQQVRATVDHQLKDEKAAIPEGKKGKKAMGKIKKMDAQMSRDIMSVFKNYHRSAISLNDKRDLRLPKNYQYNDAEPDSVVTPHVLFGTMPAPREADGQSSVEQFASWVTSRNNPQFTRVYINRLWQHAFGYGLVEPLDNWTDRTKVSHPDVLDTLSQIAHASDFNTREILRVMFHTMLFQREAYSKELVGGQSYDFRGPILRRMSAEQVYDSLLTLAKGNIDSDSNEKKLATWEQFQRETDYMLTASPEFLIKMDDRIDSIEEAVRTLQQKAAKMRIEKNKLVENGKQMLANKTQRELDLIYKEIKAVRKNAMKDQSMEMEMAMMSNSYNLRVPDRKLYRAAEMNTPFRAGSFNREFGASDRKTTNAQKTDATIPQALLLLNSEKPHEITVEKGELAKRILKAGSASERLDVLFLSIYNRYPNSDDRKQLSSLHRNRQDAQLLAKAMLNSKRFLFIQ